MIGIIHNMDATKDYVICLLIILITAVLSKITYNTFANTILFIYKLIRGNWDEIINALDDILWSFW